MGQWSQPTSVLPAPPSHDVRLLPPPDDPAGDGARLPCGRGQEVRGKRQGITEWKTQREAQGALLLSASPLPPLLLTPCSLLRRAPRGFTLIELLTVIAIIGILVSIAVTVGRGVQERGKIAQAKAEMAVLAAALEAYKAHYGDYPWTPNFTPSGVTDPDNLWDGGAVLFNALSGNLGPTANTALIEKGRVFVEISRFSVADKDELPNPENTNIKLNWFNDPWGRWYYYHYKKSATDSDWKSLNFLLYSHGPNKECDIGGSADSGMLDVFGGLPDTEEARRKNADNIYFGRY